MFPRQPGLLRQPRFGLDTYRAVGQTLIRPEDPGAEREPRLAGSGLEEAARTEGSEASLVSDKPWRETATLDRVLEVWRRRKWCAIVTFAPGFPPALARQTGRLRCPTVWI